VELTAPVDLVQQQRNRGSSGVGVRLQVRRDSAEGDVENLGDPFENAGCGLVRNDHRDVFESEPVDAENFEDTLGHRSCSRLEDLLAVHLVVGVPRVDREMIYSFAVGQEDT
jgi:hypothetical protein